MNVTIFKIFVIFQSTKFQCRVECTNLQVLKCFQQNFTYFSSKPTTHFSPSVGAIFEISLIMFLRNLSSLRSSNLPFTCKTPFLIATYNHFF